MRVLLTLAVAAALGAGAGFAPEQQAELDKGLNVLGIKTGELGFLKQWSADSFFRLKAVDRCLDDPLQTAVYTDSSAALCRSFEDNPLRLLLHEWHETDCGIGARDSAVLRKAIALEARTGTAGTERLPGPLAAAINTVLAGYRVGDKYLEQSVRGLTATELDRLLGEAPDFWRDAEDSSERSIAGSLHREFGKEYDTSQDVKAETILGYTRKLDRKALSMSGLAVVLAAVEAEKLLDAPTESGLEAPLFEVEGISGEVRFVLETEYGLVVVGSKLDNAYRRECCLIIEPGGDDNYFNRAGGAVGFLGSPFSVVFDLGGNDRYQSDRMFAQGAALFGCGVLIDWSGNDVYRASHYSQACGIFGTGLLVDRQGDDIYDAGFCAQGAGHFGAGLLSEIQGRDCYRSTGYCMGFSSTWGYGLLAEYAGNDDYYAGGRYLHEPLLPHEYRSFSHGFSIGWRPDAAGGIALLYDKSGNDFYDAEVYAQGTSYWYSLGMLYDGEGYDHYMAAQYSQGAGIHLSVGALIDEQGNDVYYSRLGPSQGQGHDLSVGLLLDRKGNDVYASSGQGVGLTNSVGLFCDVTGDDYYTGVDPAGGHPARGFASIGNFLDLAGHDYYLSGTPGADSSFWINGTYGAGADLSNVPVPGDEADEGDTAQVAEIDTLAVPIESLFKIDATWEVGNARARVRQARKQFNALGRRAVEYVFEKKADTKDGLELRAIEELVKAFPDTAKPFLFKALRDERLYARSNAAYLLGKLGKDGRDGVESLLVALKEDRISPRRAAGSFGDIGDSLVIPRILYLLKDSYEPSRIVTAEACGKLKNPAAIPDLVRTLSDRLFTVRSAAEMALEQIGKESLDSLLLALPQLKSPALGHAIRCCGTLAAKFDTADTALGVRCRTVFSGYLEYKEPFVRLVAVQALERFLDEPLKATLEAARAKETNRFVLGQYAKILKN